ncbi:type II toxin-antitoxin system RelE family toxin [Streptomyces spiralis]|uniref:type II toxin-antitoxin system RelE family toxin n=1 Tax=Streptomyces spiralis TaxID=66376 RepID=UPI0033FE9A86
MGQTLTEAGEHLAFPKGAAVQRRWDGPGLRNRRSAATVWVRRAAHPPRAQPSLRRSVPRGCRRQEAVGHEDLYRLRVGVYRIAYMIDDGKLVILVVEVGHRREIYRRLRCTA